MRQTLDRRELRSEVLHVRRRTRPRTQGQLPGPQATAAPLHPLLRRTLPRHEEARRPPRHGARRDALAVEGAPLRRGRPKQSDAPGADGARLPPQAGHRAQRHQAREHPLRPRPQDHQAHRLRHLAPHPQEGRPLLDVDDHRHALLPRS